MKHVDKDHENSLTFLQIRDFFTTELAYRHALNTPGTGKIAAILSLLDQLQASDALLSPADNLQNQQRNSRKRAGGNSQDPPPRQ